jgi:hypothetical protein
MFWMIKIIGPLIALAGAVQLIRGVFIGYRAVNQVPPAHAFRYMMWGNNWIWFKPNEPPEFLNEEGLRLDRRRRQLMMQGLVWWALAMPFFVANALLA